MKKNLILFFSAALGIACGLASQSSFLAGQWANLILWGIAGVLLGLFTNGRRVMIWAGITYGVCLSIAFLLSGFQGSADKLPGFLALTLALSVIGAIGGLVTVFVGSRLRQIVKPRS
jgi:fucose 4-O-acetylase-like acetyltransferase